MLTLQMSTLSRCHPARALTITHPNPLRCRHDMEQLASRVGTLETDVEDVRRERARYDAMQCSSTYY